MMHPEQAIQLPNQTRRKDLLTDGSSTWINELGSTMQLDISGASLTGTYTSAVSGENGQPVQGALVGWLNNGVIGFIVCWPNSVTSWTGHLVFEKPGSEGQLVIESLWHLGLELQSPLDPDDVWNSVLTGADRFVLQMPGK